MNKIKAILIDDEEKALAGLKIKIIKYFPEIEIVALCNKPEVAITTINELNPDLVFIDIEMPVLSGFDVLAKISNPNFETIFVTAYDNYAIDAIKACAIGYVVKPIDIDELKLAVHNAFNNINRKTALDKNIQLLSNLSNRATKSSIAIPSQKGLSFIKTETIIRFEGVDGYTRIYCIDQKSILSSYNIGKFSKLLADSNFYQCHKSHLINLNYVTTILKEGSVEFTDKSVVTFSKNKRSELMERLKSL